ncbi:hypothetical protein FQN55_007751 [Onygenales sp. PD_40]|nr:hypothetical protein FQN55_007751 [Onygenales sp. PD_40]KAK2775381.1 hypothetical protein FQN53_003168 [Emmonsiellopsis sp. PD_33]KAK2783805.1 hypothetical protein FQN52_009452 [Onygenales sp. PD_12]KAK2793798.1 hypothetical protein FQN51_001016 [Onygenales sp. PD_10]
MHISISLVSLGLVGLSHAARKSIVTELTFPMQMDAQPLVGSVMQADPTATTYLVSCREGTQDVDCGVPSPGLTLTQAGETIGFEATISESSKTMTVLQVMKNVCEIHDEQATCTAFRAQGSASDDLSSIEPETTSFPATMYISNLDVTLTAGLEKIAAETSAPSTGSSPTETVSQTGTPCPAPTGGDGGPSTTSSTGGAALAMITGAANWGVIGGAAMAAAAMAL